MKKAIFTIALLFFLSILKTNGQIYSQGYAGYAGLGIIYYPNGYYQGQVYNGYANGTGTFYWADGSFYYGSFNAGFYNGAGVLMSRYYGYISGCWYGGAFMGACQNVYNPYNQSKVENLVSQVQQDKPANTTTNNYQSYDPDGYMVTQIDPNTQMGKTVLGKYK
ncbi:hypothetical protein [Flavobacterium sp. HJJ]|uniref:hypothetical protein n=1 Tax=Flavobacterium sp. HJJ TaxID=2783792 RepID=UPI00188CC6FA|nr:hypothetical protein [Flavobacterium sp. HJJ]MBF4473053.1 hypothetical protein [Flavobacterium sp. HJJ]